jgi:uncharacterized protein (TIGR03118 family)
MRNPFRATTVAAALILGALSLAAGPAEGSGFVQTNLVSDIPKLAAITDRPLRNPWGVAHGPSGPFWISNFLDDTSTFYAVTEKTKVRKVGGITTPKTARRQGPTGLVFNANAASFPVKNGGDGRPAIFIFADWNGTISAWDSGATAIVQVTSAAAGYTGLAVNPAQTCLYAANIVGGGSVDVFDSAFRPLQLGAGAFVDPSLPQGLVPFNVQDLGGDLYVTYAPAGPFNEIRAPLGAGAVAIFDEDGRFIKQLIAGSRLAAPWGIALAPPSFGRFGSALLIGNFSNLHSEINAFSPTDGTWIGTLPVTTGGMSPGGLWWIGFGDGGSAGSPDILYFTDGINGEADGLFGAISAQ